MHSTTPKPVVRRPGSMPSTRMGAIGPELSRCAPTATGLDSKIPAHRVKEHRRREAERRDPVEQADRAGHRNTTAPVAHAGVTLERLHHELAERSGRAGDRAP